MSASVFRKDFSRQLENLRLVVLDCFYDLRNNDAALEWLGKLFRFKVNSYSKEYPYGMLPFGAIDLVATHWTLCKKENDDLIPLMSIKTTDSKRSKMFRLGYPGFDPIAGEGLENHRSAVARELESVEKEGSALGYVGSWAVDPGVHKDRVLTVLSRKVTSAIVSRWFHSFDVCAAVTYASVRFNVAKFHDYLGMVPLKEENGQELASFKMYSAFDELLRASILYRGNLSAECRRDMQELESLWEKRITFASENSPLCAPQNGLPQAA